MAIVVQTAVLISVALLTFRVLQTLVFHPLARFPGPKLWSFSRLPYVLSLYHGNLVHDVLALHAKYGPIVRIAPNELSFTDPQACRDIYGKRQGHLPFGKSQIWVPTPPKNGPRAPNILNADDEDHARIRKAWSYGFSDKALKEQEGVVMSYVDKFILQIRRRIDERKGHGDLDIVKWFNYCAFDIVGDLTFGESFGCLDHDEYHDWVGVIIHHFKAAILMTAYKYYPWYHRYMSRYIPKESIIKQQRHFAYASEKVRNRLASEKERPDFVSHLSKSRQGLSDKEIDSTAAIIIIAGSNSLTTTLSGTTNYLLRNPRVLRTLSKELRTAFMNEAEMTVQALQQLPYLNAVIEEGLRIVTPVPLGMPRIVPKGGDTVCGHYLPEETTVSYQSYASTHSPHNFDQPDEFRPERWLYNSRLPINGIDSSYASPNGASKGESGHVDHLEASQPFSLGPRSCLGRSLAYFELRLVLARLVWNFDLSLPHGQGTGLQWTDQKTYATWVKEEFEIRVSERIKL